MYQAELIAIKEVAQILRDIPDLMLIKFYVDSQAALCTLQSDFLKSKLALQIIHALNQIKHKLLAFVWTKAHVGIHGNEEAGQLAKEGSTLLEIIPIPPPACSSNQIAEKGIRALWQKEWDAYP